MQAKSLKDFYKDKKIFITGHTGFKGTWLTSTLIEFGANVMGYSKSDQRLKFFKQICNYKKINNIYADILNYRKLKQKIFEFQPQIIFHLAAQSLVVESYKNPYKTFETNISGTLNILDISNDLKSLKSLVIITSDKCYLNKELERGYKENDILGGDDPYSASKASAELIFNSYAKSFYNKKKQLGFVSVRAGNVIGGGDWSKYRIIPDCIDSIKKKKKLLIRNPNSTRPWQHVLEPISGYLLVAKKLFENKKKFSGSWNFGPPNRETMKVKKVVNQFFNFLNIDKKFYIKKGKFKESNLLKLNSKKAINLLKWKNTWGMKKSILETAKWYKIFIQNGNLKNITLLQIREYFQL